MVVVRADVSDKVGNVISDVVGEVILVEAEEVICVVGTEVVVESRGTEVVRGPDVVGE